MNDPIQGRIPREALLEWLNSSTPLLQAVNPGRSETRYTFVKIPQLDKAVTSPPHTPSRNAGRGLRFYGSPERFGAVLQKVP